MHFNFPSKTFIFILGLSLISSFSPSFANTTDNVRSPFDQRLRFISLITFLNFCNKTDYYIKNSIFCDTIFRDAQKAIQNNTITMNLRSVDIERFQRLIEGRMNISTDSDNIFKLKANTMYPGKQNNKNNDEYIAFKVNPEENDLSEAIKSITEPVITDPRSKRPTILATGTHELPRMPTQEEIRLFESYISRLEELTKESVRLIQLGFNVSVSPPTDQTPLTVSEQDIYIMEQYTYRMRQISNKAESLNNLGVSFPIPRDLKLSYEEVSRNYESNFMKMDLYIAELTKLEEQALHSQGD